MIFFDEGHGEYRKLYRKARVFLPTGSQFGGWTGTGYTQNLPLDNFTKDANMKESEHCFFTQLADLLSHALLNKVRGELQLLSPSDLALGQHQLYDCVPMLVLNTRASSRDPQGIVRLP